jgi:hypothetical protein
MPSPCNNLNVVPIKVSKLVRYQNLDANDFFLTVESGSSLTSRRSTLADLKNALNKLTGSYTGSFLGRFSGSFTGSFKGKLSGSFSGSHYGKFIGKNASVSGSFSGSFYGITNFSKTSSYLLQTTQNTTKGVGYFDGTRLISAPGLLFDNNTSGVKSLSVSSSLPFNYLNVASRGLTSGGVQYNQAAISLFNLNSSEAYPNRDGWTIFSNRSGSLTFTTPIGSYEISNSSVVSRATAGEAIIYGMVQRRNGFYFWPYMTNNTPSRDGAIGIGVQPPNEPTGSFDKYLRAKLQINMFSGSGEGPWSIPATVENRATAILVNYGSGSTTTGFTKTFFVSGSGNTYIHGKLNVNRGVTGSFRGVDNITNFKGTGKKVSYNGTSSYSVSSSYSILASTASYISTGGGDIFANAYYVQKTGGGTPVSTGTANTFGNIVVPAGKTLKWFKIEGSFNVSENNGVTLNGVSLGGTLVSSNVYSSWGWQKGYYYNPDSGDIITHFTIEGIPPAAVTTGTISVVVHTTNVGSNTCNGYAVGYF